jgi:membrane associated rhomboid family serine protease
MNLIIVFIIIVITALSSYKAFNDRLFFDKLKFNAAHTINAKEYYRLLSYGLIHADWLHLIVNMYVLYIFGEIVMFFFSGYFQAFGNLYFLGLYIPAIAISSIPSLIKYKDDYTYNAVGASGAVSAVVFSSIMLYPFGEMGFLFIPIMIPSWVFGLIYLVYSAYMSKKKIDNIGHDAHFWGAIYGIAYTIIIKPEVINNFIG